MQFFFVRNLKCWECKARTARPPKSKLLELELALDICKRAFKERNWDDDDKTTFLIISNDDFFNHVVRAALVREEFTVVTGILDGMIREEMFRYI
ncbi:unnamed protein product [Arabis nemorensis]|uniref:Uncharacterized protein n=1 Tax=Arabis nemorensis TaxID=586526 RepID=A0A565BW08_9BRAS|nr:unnamed protein product [Arabis nemorensis]